MSTAPVTTATATVTSDGCAVVELDGQPPQQLQADDLSQARHQAVELVIVYARHIGQPVALLARDGDASHRLEIHPDGTVHPAEPAPAAQRGQGSAPSSSAGPPIAGRPRRRWPLVAAAAATGLAVSAALWLSPAATTPETAPTVSAPGTAAARRPAPVTVDADTLGVTAAARSAAPRPVPLPVLVAPVAWNGAAAWQEQRTRQAARPVTTWTAGPGPSGQLTPVPAASGTSTAPTSRAPAAAPPPTRPQVIINPDPAAAAPRPAPTQPAGPAMPDQPTNPINPN